MRSYDEWKLSTPPEYAEVDEQCRECGDQENGCPLCAPEIHDTKERD